MPSPTITDTSGGSGAASSGSAELSSTEPGDGYAPPEMANSGGGSNPYGSDYAYGAAGSGSPQMSSESMYGGGMPSSGDPYGGNPYGQPAAPPATGLGSLFGINLSPSPNPNSMYGDGYGAGMSPYGAQNAPPKIDEAPGEDADLLTKAKYAFAIGKEKEAIEYARAYAVATAESGEVQQMAKWSTAASQPATTMRFAVGIVLEAPAALTDLKPIGSKQLQGGGGGGGMGMGYPSGQANQNATKERDLYSVTGSFGEAIVDGFKERWSSGKLGMVFSDVTPKKVGLAAGPQAPGMGMMGSMMGGPGMSSEGVGSDPYGGAPPDAMMGMGSGGAPAANQPKIMPGSSVTPGMIYIGTFDKEKSLMEKAALQNVDAVFIFDVTVSAPNRINGVIQNEARLRLLSTKGDLLARSSELLNTKVERALLSTAGDDEVKKATDKFFAQFDEKVQMADMPALKPEVAKARLTSLLANPAVDALQKLFEVSLYHSMKLISDEDKATCYLIVMQGSEGESLASGALADRQAVLEPLLPTYK